MNGGWVEILRGGRNIYIEMGEAFGNIQSANVVGHGKQSAA